MLNNSYPDTLIEIVFNQESKRLKNNIMYGPETFPLALVLPTGSGHFLLRSGSGQIMIKKNIRIRPDLDFEKRSGSGTARIRNYLIRKSISFFIETKRK